MAQRGDGTFDGESVGWIVPTVALVVVLVAVGLAGLVLVEGPPERSGSGVRAEVAGISVERTTPPSGPTGSGDTTSSLSTPAIAPTTGSSPATIAPTTVAATTATSAPTTTTPVTMTTSVTAAPTTAGTPPAEAAPPATVAPNDTGSTSYRAPDGAFTVMVRTSPLRSNDRVEVLTGLATRSEYLLPTLGGAQVIITVTPDQLGAGVTQGDVDRFVAARAGGPRWWVGSTVTPTGPFDLLGGRAVDAAVTFPGGQSRVRSVDVGGRLHQLTLILPTSAAPAEVGDAVATYLEVLATYRPAG